VQADPAATELPQVLLCRKSPLFVPPIAMLVIVSTDPPVLVRVIFCDALVVCSGWLVKARLVGERLAAGALLTPVPVSVAGTGETVEELKLTLTVALNVPVAAGVKETLIVQEPPEATAVQLLVWKKSDGFTP